LIPFGTECTLVVDWKGLAELALRSGMIARLHADLICENDVFDYNMGEILCHKINFKEPRGEPYAAYAMAETKDGAKFVQVMTRQQIETIRNDSQGYKAAVKYQKDSPWTTAPGEMWKKTVFLQLQKLLPKSAEMQKAIAYDASAETGQTLRELGMPEPYDVQAEEVPVSDPLDKISDELEGASGDDASDMFEPPAGGWSDQG